MNCELIKACGMRDVQNINEVAALNVDMMGFIFYPESPRFVKMISSMAGIIPNYSRERLEKMQGEGFERKANHPARVGVFVDEMPQTIITCIYNYNLDYVQLHGAESREMVENLRRTVDPDIHPGIKVIKAISVKSAEDIEKYKEYEGIVDLFLFDTKCKSVGGSGEQFDWSVLENYKGETPFLLSGGIGPEDANRVLAFEHPKCVGIDLNSKFEIEPALKDVEKLKLFINKIRGNE